KDGFMQRFLSKRKCAPVGGAAVKGTVEPASRGRQYRPLGGGRVWGVEADAREAQAIKCNDPPARLQTAATDESAKTGTSCARGRRNNRATAHRRRPKTQCSGPLLQPGTSSRSCASQKA